MLDAMDISAEAGRWLIECCDSGLAQMRSRGPSKCPEKAWSVWLQQSSCWIAHLLLMLMMDVSSDAAYAQVRRVIGLVRGEGLGECAREATSMECGGASWIGTVVVTRAADDVVATVLSLCCSLSQNDICRRTICGDTALHLAAMNGTP
eukprot:COSAG05_NODE_1100_length_5884_cov_7.338634_1_plen_149_part_00